MLIFLFAAVIVAQDQGRLQSQVDTAAATNRPLKFAAGTYEIDRLLLSSNSHLIGAGIGRTIIKSTKAVTSHSGQSSEKTVSPLVRNRHYRQTRRPLTRNITIEGITFIGNRTTQQYNPKFQYYAGLALSGVESVTIKNCEFRNFHGDGICINSGHVAGVNRNIRISKNKTVNCLRGGITIVTATDSMVDHNYITGAGHGLHVENGKSALHQPIQNLTIAYNTVSNTTERPFWLASPRPQAVTGLKIYHNRFADCTIVNQNSPLFIAQAAQAVWFDNVFENISTDHYLFRIGGDSVWFVDNQIINCHCADRAIELMGPLSSDRCLSRVAGNYFQITNNGPRRNTDAFLKSTSRGGFKLPVGVTISENVIFCDGFYYGINCDVKDAQILRNTLTTTDGTRGVYNGRYSTNSILVGNTIKGWPVPIYRLAERRNITNSNILIK